jgi:ribosomal protein S18 acetylase RimI-like enzyme
MNNLAESIVIRRLDGDTEAWACADIMAAAEPWLRYGRSRETNRSTLTAPGVEAYVAVDADHQVLGVVALALKIPLIRGYILALAVAPHARNRGIGTKLLRHAEQRIFRESPNVFICVSSFNTGAQRLYQRLGFEQIGVIADYVAPGAHEHLLRKTLGPQSTFKPSPA